MSLLDDSIASLQNLMNSAAATTDQWSTDWDAKKNELLQKAAEFSQVYNSLINQQAIAASDPTLNDQYNTVMSQGDYIKNTVQNITSSFDTAASWFNNLLSTAANAVGLGNVPVSINFREVAKRSGMGFVGIVSIAVISVAIAAIVYWLQDAYQLQSKMNAVAQQENKTPQQQSAFEKLWQTVMGSGTSTSSNVKDATKYLAIAGVSIAALYFLWPVIKRWRK